MTWRDLVARWRRPQVSSLELRLEGSRMALTVHGGRSFRAGPKSLRGLGRVMIETADQIENSPRRVADSVIFAERLVPRDLNPARDQTEAMESVQLLRRRPR